MNRRTVAILAVVLSPVMLPVTCAVAGFETWTRALGWRDNGPRHGTLFWRIWWVYGGYLGFYRIDWMMKARVTGLASCALERHETHTSQAASRRFRDLLFRRSARRFERRHHER